MNNIVNISSDKVERILYLHKYGKNPKQIARKLGYGGNAYSKGINIVRDVLKFHGHLE